MKPSSEKPARPGVSRETAIGCLAANVAIPGTGTFLSGRRVIGAVQTVLGVVFLGVSMITGVKMIGWMLANWSRLQDPYGDPLETLQETWTHIKWPLGATVLFAVVWVWAVLDAWLLVRKTQKKENTAEKR